MTVRFANCTRLYALVVTDGGTEAHRSRRRDAARNRERLLEAAQQVFAERGPDVALEEIAQLANVSRTTLYRNFPSREELAATLYEDGLVQLETRAAALVDDPLGALTLVDLVLELQVAHRLVAALSSQETAAFAGLAERTARAFEPVVEAAVAAGSLRSGLGLPDVLLALRMAEVTMTDKDPDRRRRHHRRAGTLLLHGLFADEAVEAFRVRRRTAVS